MRKIFITKNAKSSEKHHLPQYYKSHIVYDENVDRQSFFCDN